MSWIAVAIVGSATVGAVATSLAANTQAEATTAASQTVAEGTAASNVLLQQQYEQTRADQEPWRLAGEKALQNIQATPDFDFTREDFFADPSYKFRMEEGVSALDRSAASRGRVQSGGQQRAVTRYGSDLASQEYGNAFNRALTTYSTNLNTQKSLAGAGQQAVGATGAAGQASASGQASNIMSGAGVTANLQQQQGQNTANMYGQYANVANTAMGNYLLSKQP